ncbi:hypothetical protein [Methanosphaerula palustris]|uniref:hypothetical protein n=1 Tax=Methanosphaerula palustris TaxID=475088 RepID=UPI0011D07774|nr:hypothetical protein [Methanosphaerula palustris]
MIGSWWCPFSKRRYARPPGERYQADGLGGRLIAQGGCRLVLDDEARGSAPAVFIRLSMRISGIRTTKTIASTVLSVDVGRSGPGRSMLDEVGSVPDVL